MSKPSSNSGLIAAGLGLAAVGLIGAAIWASADDRQSFTDALREDLLEHNIELVSCQIGRSPTNALVWVVALRAPIHGVLTLEAEFPPETRAYAQTTREELVTRLLRYLRGDRRA